MSWKRAPVPLAAAVEALARRVEPLTPLARVQRAWPAVGPVVAAQATPTEVRAGVLTVQCASATWAQELQLMAADLVARLNDAIGEPPLTDLRVRGPAGRRRHR